MALAVNKKACDLVSIENEVNLTLKNKNEIT